MKKITLIVASCLYAVACMAGELKTVIYPIVFGDLDAMTEFADSTVGDDGNVVLDKRGSRLIVVTTPQKHQMLEEVLGAADAKTGNVQINVRFIDRGQVRESGVGVRGGEISIGPGGSGSSISVQPELRHETTEWRSETAQFIVAASGREGILRVGERVPYIDWIMEYTWQVGLLSSRVNWQEVGAFLVVTPTIMPDRRTVHIRLTPELRGLVNGRPEHTRFIALSTEVIVSEGESISLGGLAKDESFYSRFLIGADRSGAKRSLDIELSPRIIESSGVVR